MLVLRRKVGEEIRIGDGVVIKVVAVNGRTVRIGIEAPRSMPIWRVEGPSKGEPASSREAVATMAVS